MKTLSSAKGKRLTTGLVLFVCSAFEELEVGVADFGRDREFRVDFRGVILSCGPRCLDNRVMVPTPEMVASRPDVQAMKGLLLQHGGTDINVPSEWFDEPSTWKVVMAEVYHRGRPMDATRVERRTMEDNECHKNTTTLFLTEQVPSFATGFALHENGVWYFHSWGIRSSCCGEVIVETHQDTFRHYFGPECSGESGKAIADGLYRMVTSGNVPFSGALFGREWEP
jgi:hypothetical protein